MNTSISLADHRVHAENHSSVCEGTVVWSPMKSLWFSAMSVGTIAAFVTCFSWAGFGLFLMSTAWVLLAGHSLGSHRKLIHNSYQCPLWLERIFVYSGVLVGLAGPLGLLRQHELRDYAQRLPTCHDYLRHGRSFWLDAWWQLHCELKLTNPPIVRVEEKLVGDRFLQFLERTWMLQQLPWAIAFYAWGGWSFILWGVCARVTAGVLGHWLIGYFAHNHGAMHFSVDGAAVQGRNIHLASLLTMGECWHNNHHAYPGSARLGLFPGEWDPGWWMLSLLERLGLAWGFRLPEHLPERKELRLLEPTRLFQTKPSAATLSCFEMFRLGLTGADGISISWPGSIASAKLLTALVGSGTHLSQEPQCSRLTLDTRCGSAVGMPALCLGIGQRGAAVRMLMLLFLPIAMLLNGVRSAFAMPAL
jgi:fatty-acid desaturase